mmetsp:Transcript_38213/g.46623  ORF Transcript_38213/g.46623 Transcript_38213/m.46623 type:complete len:203 (+) Transcript_38213:79-687(+)|eukprot:CAMPEP_0172515162 /NCGR_PEP_ID=MMETSP1066-20121228/265890_1 /TAXON_ID=671091 /ORGANISM="Coscinodiscus wailesii, Strain CCMP2513" /LENGTH=202 /DNA_ID=CAMNT_0013296133 /DNA_START=53 /DNA_END=661 /DNA_ORIENTATION=+
MPARKNMSRALSAPSTAMKANLLPILEEDPNELNDVNFLGSLNDLVRQHDDKISEVLDDFNVNLPTIPDLFSTNENRTRTASKRSRSSLKYVNARKEIRAIEKAKSTSGAFDTAKSVGEIEDEEDLGFLSKELRSAFAEADTMIQNIRSEVFELDRSLSDSAVMRSARVTNRLAMRNRGAEILKRRKGEETNRRRRRRDMKE